MKTEYRWYLSSIKRRAKRKNIDFDLTLEFILDLLKQQNYCCALTGDPIILAKKEPRKNNNLINTASLDRKDSSKGYTKDNIQWLHKSVNDMKWHYPEKYFKEICKKVSNFDKNSDNTSLLSRDKG